MRALESAPDTLLVQRASDGDEVAFGILVRRYAPYLRAFATRLGGSAADADDAVQDALIVAWNRLGELEDPTRLKSWLSTIVSRKVMDVVRARRPADEVEKAAEAGAPQLVLTRGPESQAISSSQLDALSTVLEALPLEQRQIWVLKEVGGYSYEEIAERVGESVSTVRGRLARARASVLDGMKDWR